MGISDWSSDVCASDLYVRGVRNTLLRRAVDGTQFEVLNDVFKGPTLIAFSNEHPGAAARIFKEFSKGQDKFEIKAAAFEGQFLAAKIGRAPCRERVCQYV